MSMQHVSLGYFEYGTLNLAPLNRGDMLISEQHWCSNEKEISAQGLNSNPLNCL